MSNKSFGLNKERVIKKHVVDNEGALYATRQRGSFGFADVLAFYNDKCVLISVKSTKQQYSSYTKEIDKLKQIKVPKYCQKQLRIWWSPRKDRKKKGWEILNIK